MLFLDLQNKNVEPLKLLIACGAIKQNEKGIKINSHINCYMYAWITCHPQVVQSPISNYYLKGMFDDQT